MRPLIKSAHNFIASAASMPTDIRLLPLKRESMTGRGDIKNTNFGATKDSAQASAYQRRMVKLVSISKPWTKVTTVCSTACYLIAQAFY